MALSVKATIFYLTTREGFGHTTRRYIPEGGTLQQ
jgi:hypothetical protein